MPKVPEHYARELDLIGRVEADERIDDMVIWQMLQDYPEIPYFIYTEDREQQTYLRDTIPVRWKDRKPGEAFRGEARPGELFLFQVSLYACKMALEDVRLSFGALNSSGGGRIEPAAFTVINYEGKDYLGNPFVKRMDVPAGRLQTLWVCVEIPTDAASVYGGEVEVRTANIVPQRFALSIEVSGAVLEDHGVGEAWRMSRLAWLNSDLAIDDEIVAPYVPIEADQGGYRYLGRRVGLTESGLPERLTGYYTSDNRVGGEAKEILSSPVRFVVVYEDGHEAVFRWSQVQSRMSENGGLVEWTSEAGDGTLTLRLSATLEYEGFTNYRLDLDSGEAVAIRDVRLEIPYRSEAAQYWAGLGNKGGLRAGGLEWRWDQSLWQDTLWMGDVNAGLSVHLLDPDYERPHPIFYYLYKPLKMPRSWENGGRGGVRVSQTGETVLFTAYSGGFTTTPGRPYSFCFNLFVTPVKPIDYEEHWSSRYMHAPRDPGEMAAEGVTVVNVHHGHEHAPFINFPFIGHKMLKAYADDCHDKGMKVKVYYTVREMTHKQTELWAFRDMNDEIIADGSGIGFFDVIPENLGVNSWHRKYLGDHYIPAYVSTMRHGRAGVYQEMMDRTVVVAPFSRYNNYYIEDIAWLIKNAGIDGIYIDDFAPDRTVLRRARKVIDRLCPGGLIDMHSWSHFKGNTFGGSRHAGYVNSILVEMGNLPYLNRTMFGEGFDYVNDTPDNWLIEISGLPFGVITDMLNREPSKGNPYRGMVYGVTPRMPGMGDLSLAGLWRYWDEFGIGQARLLGYWNPECPVKTDDERVRASVYARQGRALIAVANWSNDETVDCALEIDWEALGLDPAKASLTARTLDTLQEEAVFDPRGSIPLPPAKGWILELSSK